MVNLCGGREVGCTSFASTGNKARLIGGRQDGGRFSVACMKGAEVKVQ